MPINNIISKNNYVGESERRRTNANGALAEGVGFEPTIRLPVYTLSKRAPSATRPSLRRETGNIASRPAVTTRVRDSDRALVERI